MMWCDGGILSLHERINYGWMTLWLTKSAAKETHTHNTHHTIIPQVDSRIERHEKPSHPVNERGSSLRIGSHLSHRSILRLSTWTVQTEEESSSSDDAGDVLLSPSTSIGGCSVQTICSPVCLCVRNFVVHSVHLKIAQVRCSSPSRTKENIVPLAHPH